jgi:glycosyltransferase involved in cell wall biosynthesis
VRSLILADRAFVNRERALLSRLSMGLADDGVRVSAALPISLIERTQNDFPVGPVIGYEDTGVFLSRSPRVTRFIERLRAPDRDKTQFDIIHAFGGSAWNFALDLGRRLDALTVLEVWRPGLADRACSLRSGTQRVSFFAPSPGIERLLLKEGAGLTVRLTQWGVWATKSPNPIMREERAPSIVLIASGRDSSAVTAAFLGAASVLRSHSQVMLFVDADAARRSPIWKLARQEDIVDRVSIIDAVEERRDLVIRCDLLLYPEARGEQRSVIYDAMGAGMAVIAAADPMNPALIPDVTARVLSDPGAEMWNTEIARLIDQPEVARGLGRSARDRIRNDFRATSHIRSVLEAYEWLLSSKPITATAVR